MFTHLEQMLSAPCPFFCSTFHFFVPCLNIWLPGPVIFSFPAFFVPQSLLCPWMRTDQKFWDIHACYFRSIPQLTDDLQKLREKPLALLPFEWAYSNACPALTVSEFLGMAELHLPTAIACSLMYTKAAFSPLPLYHSFLGLSPK